MCVCVSAPMPHWKNIFKSSNQSEPKEECRCRSSETREKSCNTWAEKSLWNSEGDIWTTYCRLAAVRGECVCRLEVELCLQLFITQYCASIRLPTEEFSAHNKTYVLCCNVEELHSAEICIWKIMLSGTWYQWYQWYQFHPYCLWF